MIKDKLINAENYYMLSRNIKAGFEWLKKTDLENLSDGKYYINGEDLYANVQTYQTKDDANFEAHRGYIDIQYMIKGGEYVGYTHISNCAVCEEYDKSRDIEFLTCADEIPYQLLSEGEFLLFYPQDAHKPSINPNVKNTVKKVVVKVKI